MENKSGFVLGVLFTLSGILLVLIGLFIFNQIDVFNGLIIYGVVSLGFGVYILLNYKEEDRIEQIKEIKTIKKSGGH